MTNQRQTVLVFVGITGLLIPMLLAIIAPIALVVAVGHTLNRLNTDSEIVVMNASGMSPWRIFRPFLTTTLVVSALVRRLERLPGAEGPARTAQLGGQHQGRPRDQHHPARPLHHDRARPDVPHPRAAQRRQLLGIFIDDRRDPKERVTSISEYGEIVETARGTFLLLVNGSVHRLESGRPIRPS